MSTPVANGETTKSRRPKNTKFKQQNLPAWQPILTAGSVLPAFYAIGICFIPLGVALLVTSNNIQEKVIDYTQCTRNENLSKCATVIGKDIDQTCTCNINFTLDTNFEGEVYLYYGLTNYYQNHRRYVKSRDDNQLNGMKSTLSEDCEPYRIYNGSYVAPCGAIANSLFNDTFKLYSYASGDMTEVNLIRTGIAWKTDKEDKYKNPEHSGNLSEAFAGMTKPPSWKKSVFELDPDDPTNNGYKNEDLIVWMRTAALPKFRKLHRRILNGLKQGEHLVTISYAYPVTSFDGTKSFILTTTSWLGGKNSFLGIAYLVVGSLCVALGTVFLIIHIKIGKKSKDVINVDSNSTY